METRDRLPKHLLIGFLLALGIYAAFFTGDQWVRQRRGAWRVHFATNGTGEAQIIINQSRLHITNVQITFSGERPTNLVPGEVTFRVPGQQLPFGKAKFEDLTYLPGSVAFDFFGHEVELLPRTLYLNKQERNWISNTNITVASDQKLRPEMSYDPRKKKRR